MVNNSVFNSNTSAITLEHIEQATEKLNELLPENWSNSIFQGMLVGFKKLLEFLELKCSENEFEAVLRWSKLFLKIQSSLDPKNEELRQQFESIVPPVVTYIIGFLQHKPQRMSTYHYQLLDITHTLLTNVKLYTLKKLAYFAPGIIACLWFPIDFVGDFNTQLMALRIFTMLLKCVDDAKKQREIEHINCPQKDFIKNKLDRVVAVTNCHEGLFENVARNLLNNYNMNLAENVLVYSCRCRYLHLGTKFEFFKAQNADNFWVDFNYCPRTLSFSGRYKSQQYNQFVNVSAVCHIRHIHLSEQLLLIDIKPPTNFSVKNHDLAELKDISSLRIKLPDVEFLRLQQNNFLIEYYNSPEEVANKTTISQQDATPHAINDPEINLPQVENYDTNSQSLTCSDNFQRSYDILIGHSGSNRDSHKDASFEEEYSTPSISKSSTKELKDAIFKLPSISKYRKSIRKAKSRANMNLLKSHKNAINSTDLLLCQPHEPQSPKTSRISTDLSALKENHPIRELRVAKRFFKTTTPRRRKQNNTNFFSTSKTKRKTKITLSPKPKKIIRVKPMNYLNMTECSLEENTSIEEMGDRIINITNLLNNGHESSATYNEVQGYTEIQSILHGNNRLETPMEIENSENISLANVTTKTPPTTDLYDILDESDAEPCQSYRNFKTRRITETINTEKTKGMRNCTRKKRAVRARRVKKDLTEVAVAPSPNAKKTLRGRKTVNNPKAYQSKTKLLKTAQNEPPVEPIIGPATSSKNNTDKSASIEINQTCSEDNCHDKSSKEHLPQVSAEKDANNPPNKNIEYIRNYLPQVNPRESSINIQVQSKLISNADSGLSAAYENKNANDSVVNNLHVKQSMIYANQISTIDNNIPTYDEQFAMEIQECRNESFNTSEDSFPVVCSGNILPENVSVRNRTKRKVCTQENNQISHLHSDEPFLKKLRTRNKRTTVASNKRSRYSEKECIHHVRSDDSNDSESEYDAEYSSLVASKITNSMSMQNISATTVTDHQITTTATSIHTRLISHDILLMPTVADLSSTQGIEEIQQDSSLSAVVQCAAEIDALPILHNSCQNTELTLTPNSLNQDSTGIVDTYRCSLFAEFDELMKQTKKKCLSAFVAKVNDITKCILNETEKESAELQELEGNISRLVCQLDWQYNTYRKKIDQFKCFRENIGNMLATLSTMNICDKIDTEFDQLQKDMESSSNEKSVKQWHEFVRLSTDNLLQSINELYKF